MSSVLITGANRGIGLGLTRHLLSDPSVTTVIATARDVDSAKALKSLDNPKLHIIQLEVVSEESIEKAVEKVFQFVGDAGLDILVNNAGLGYKVPLNGKFSNSKVNEQFQVNSIAPLLIANKFYPLLKKASSVKGSAQIVNISSRLGSIRSSIYAPTDLQLSILAMSKAALNMLTRRIAVEWRDENIRATSICPGWVKTDAGSQEAELTVDESTIPLTKLILSLTEEHNAEFYNHIGETIEW